MMIGASPGILLRIFMPTTSWKINCYPVGTATICASDEYDLGTHTGIVRSNGSWYVPTTAAITSSYQIIKPSSTTEYRNIWANILDATTDYYKPIHLRTYGDYGEDNCQRILTPQEKLAEIIRSRHMPAIHIKRTPILSASEVREKRARETLRNIIGEEKYRLFLSKGFVTITNPKSGYTYQIFAPIGHKLIHVYKDGKCVERLCIYLAGNFPPTDFVITLYLMVLNNEDRVWQIGNKNGGKANLKHKELVEILPDTLPRIFAKLKGRAA
jgi:hypothetical protein